MGIRTRARHFVLGRAAIKRHAATLAALERAARPPSKLLFLCYGNICRSPVAETLARQVSDRVLARQGYAGLLRGRVLPESHFEFRGGPPGHIRPGGRLSRVIDGIR